MKKLFLIIGVIMLINIGVFAQNDPQFTNIMRNELIYNPAAIDNNGMLNATLIARKQWYGFDKSPSTQLLNLSTDIKNISGGLGLSIFNDKIGYEHNLNAKLSYAYFADLVGNKQISLGLGVGFMNKSIEGNNLIFEEDNDQYAYYAYKSKTKLDFNCGAELNGRIRGAKRAYSIGIAATHLDRGVKNSTELSPPRHYFLYGRYSFALKQNDKFVIVPFLMIKSTEYIASFDINTTVKYDDKIYGGLTYRLSDAIAILMGYQVTKDLKVSYSYDFGTGGIRKRSNGTHEIMLQGTLKGFNKERIVPKNPRI